MAFRFDFVVDEFEEKDMAIILPSNQSSEEEKNDDQDVTATKRILPATLNIHKPDISKALCLRLSDGTALLYTDVRQLCNHGDDVNKGRYWTGGVVAQAEAHHSDLIAGVYEGGLKIWECSLDLTEYLVSLDKNFNGLKVLELGCGAGLPSLYTAIKGAKVYLQDYNEEVIKEVTYPNVLLNSHDNAIDYSLYAGDWSKLGDLLNEGRNEFDLIFTSETIYNTTSYDNLHSAMAALLKRKGEIFLAAKSHYFGVGGGTDLFKQFVTSKGQFEIKTVKLLVDGVQREIIHMMFCDGQR